ncbi:MAG: twin-arginine translocase TatA/TatE family subunit [Candidatus Marinimicrobia bacterium]|nr:twin-arginine translocase TatA/TatE family subunit [Candidatus Neomarinimicrobiota bacterium]
MANHDILLAGMPGGWELIVIFLVILLLFGAKRLPELARGLGQSIREFKGAVDGVQKEIQDAADTESSPPKEEEKK